MLARNPTGNTHRSQTLFCFFQDELSRLPRTARQDRRPELERKTRGGLTSQIRARERQPFGQDPIRGVRHEGFKWENLIKQQDATVDELEGVQDRVKIPGPVVQVHFMV